MKAIYTAERYEALYGRDLLAEGIEEYEQERLQRNVKRYRLKQVMAGPMIEGDLCAIWNTQAEASTAKKAMREQSQNVIENRNLKNAERRITNLTNTNFRQGDYALYLSFFEIPKTWKDANKAIRWLIKKMVQRRTELNAGELKYLYIYESADKDGNPVRGHFHIFVNAGIPCEEIEDMWASRYGIANGTRMKDTPYGLTGFAKYILKAPREVKNRRKWAGSRNLEQPDVIRSSRMPNGKRLTRKLIDDMAAGRIDLKEFFERAYPGYQFIDATPKTSEYVSGVYLYFRMKRIRTTEIVS